MKSLQTSRNTKRFALPPGTRRQRGRTRRKTDDLSGRQKLRGFGRGGRSSPMGVKSHPPSRIQAAVGRKIRELRLSRGLSRVELARMCCMWPGHLGEIERGDHNIRLSNLLKITRNLGTTIERMLEGIM